MKPRAWTLMAAAILLAVLAAGLLKAQPPLEVILAQEAPAAGLAAAAGVLAVAGAAKLGSTALLEVGLSLAAILGGLALTRRLR